MHCGSGIEADGCRCAIPPKRHAAAVPLLDDDVMIANVAMPPSGGSHSARQGCGSLAFRALVFARAILLRAIGAIELLNCR